ncbi:MAG: efflux RND transporter periplasmic adaptor subunit [Anaerolineae bacterium]
MFRKKAFWIVLLVLALLGGGTYAAYAMDLLPWFAPEAITEGTTLETTTVTVGDISITADGTGVLVPASELGLGFDSGGTLAGLLVEPGDHVQAGDVLAWIDDTDARNAVADAQLGVLQAQQALDEASDTAALEQAVAQARLSVAQAENDLSTAQSDLADLQNWAPDETEVATAVANLAVAQASYDNTVAKAKLWDEQLASTRIKLADAVRSLDEAQVNYANAMDAARDWERNIESTRENAAKSLQSAKDNLEIAQASYDLAVIDTRQIDIENARVKLLNAQQALVDLRTPPDESEIAAAQLSVQQFEVALQQAKLDQADAERALAESDTTQAELTLQQAQLKLETAQQTLDETTLVAPFAGTVTAVNAEVSEKVSDSVIVLADMEAPLIQFWVEESDLNSVAIGHPVRIFFEALPDLTYEGEITRIDPMLVTVGNTTAVQAWASIDTAAHPATLLGEMNVEVEIVAGEALNTLLVPLQALREIGDGQYAVFVVGADGELEMRTVEVGLKDYVNAQILSGLRRGEVVSLGQKTASTTGQTSTNNSSNSGGFQRGFPEGGGMPFFPGGG